MNTNYYLTRTGYDSRGRADHVVGPTGTITDTIFTGRGLVQSTWLGTSDSGWVPPNAPAGNMVETASYTYDVDGNQTQQTVYPGGSDPNRVTQFWFDWRDRQVASKQGVQAS